MTFEEKIAYLKQAHPTICEALQITAPSLFDDLDNVTEQEIDEYNFWVQSLSEEEFKLLYEPS